MSFKWDRPALEKLITAISKHECIYNKNSPDYTKTPIKEEAYIDILCSFANEFPNITIKDIRSEWISLRRRYMHEHKHILAYGEANLPVPVTPWWYERLSFLNPENCINSLERFEFLHKDTISGQSCLRSDYDIEIEEKDDQIVVPFGDGNIDVRLKRQCVFWNRQLTERFIKIVRYYKCLYVESLPEYRDSAKRNAAYFDILTYLDPNRSQLTIKDIQRKWFSLRRAFFKAHNNLMSYRESDRTNVCTPWWYKPLHWLAESDIKEEKPTKIQHEIHVYNIQMDDSIECIERIPFEIITISDSDESVNCKIFNKEYNGILEPDTEAVFYEFENNVQCISEHEQNVSLTLDDMLQSVVSDSNNINTLLKDENAISQRLDDIGNNGVFKPDRILSNWSTDSMRCSETIKDSRHEDDDSIQYTPHITDHDYALKPPEKQLLKERNDNPESIKEISYECSKCQAAEEKSKEINYGWLRALIVCQLKKVNAKDRFNMSWEIQCLMQGYITKTQLKRRYT